MCISRIQKYVFNDCLLASMCQNKKLSFTIANDKHVSEGGEGSRKKKITKMLKVDFRMLTISIPTEWKKKTHQYTSLASKPTHLYIIFTK